MLDVLMSEIGNNKASDFLEKNPTELERIQSLYIADY